MSTKSSRVEDRVNRVRQALNSQLLDTGASAPLLSEEAVAVIVAAEARRSRELASKLGPRAYLLAHDSQNGTNSGGRKVSETNKTFLQNTIRSVESHNRREQIDSAWRQHGLLKKLDRGELLTSNGNSQQGSLSARSGSSNDHDAGYSRKSRSTSSSESHSGSGEEQEGREGGPPSSASGHNGKHARVSGGDDEDNRASGRTANGLGHEDGAERDVSKEQDGASDSKLRGVDAVEERAVWAARKARAFSATHSTSAAGHESSSTEPGELKEYKLPPGYGGNGRAGHDSDSSTDSDHSTRRGKDSKRKRKKEKKHKHHKREKSDKHHKKSHKRDRADSDDVGKPRKKAKS